jgi:hypothetical protein
LVVLWLSRLCITTTMRVRVGTDGTRQQMHAARGIRHSTHRDRLWPSTILLAGLRTPATG